MITPLESRILDANSESLGISVESLMERAGKALADFIDETMDGRVLFLCGSGNNGGDGYVAYSHLRERADVCAFKPPRSALCRIVSEGIDTIPLESVRMNDYSAIVDCILGTGASGKLKPEYVEIIDRVNGSGKTIVSCDVPTGFGSGHQVKPDCTITFHDIKAGMDESNCGAIRVCDIGIPEEATTVVNKGDFLRYPIPGESSHKGQNGRLVIIGGGPYVGAPIMAALASLRTGADLVTIVTPKASFAPIASYSPAYMVKCLEGDILRPSDVDAVLNACSKADALLIGPGLGVSDETAEAVKMILNGSEIPAVIDADGITCISGCIPERAGMIFTPHGRELSRLIGAENADDGTVEEFCRMNGCIVLRKGPVDRIYSGNRMRFNRTGTPAMTVGGTGDVLAGIVSGLVSKGMMSFDAACLGAHICGLSGERAFEKHSYGLNAVDLIDCIGSTIGENLR